MHYRAQGSINPIKMPLKHWKTCNYPRISRKFTYSFYRFIFLSSHSPCAEMPQVAAIRLPRLPYPLPLSGTVRWLANLPNPTKGGGTYKTTHGGRRGRGPYEPVGEMGVHLSRRCSALDGCSHIRQSHAPLAATPAVLGGGTVRAVPIVRINQCPEELQL